MIERAIRLMNALASKDEHHPLVERLLASRRAPEAIADAIVRGLEKIARDGRHLGVNSTWIWMTCSSAAVAAVLAAYASFALSGLLEQQLFPGAFLLPLGALLFAAGALVRWRRIRWLAGEERAELLAAELIRLKLDRDLAYEVACWLTAHEARVIVAPVTPLAASVLPVLAAAWTVITFWGLYSWTIGAVSW